MKIVRFATGKSVKYGIQEGDLVRESEGTPYDAAGLKLSTRQHNIGEIKVLTPAAPSKVVAVGLNYFSHAEELKMTIPDVPLLFLKPSTSLIGPEDDIVYPDSSERVDYEAELGVVIKGRAYRVPEAKALDYVLGYTCLNDVTARDLQKKDGQWTRAKGFDTFCAIGPHIETELDPASVPVAAYLNGELKQQSSTSDLIFAVPKLINFISNVMTLLPGDVIATGTPSGIGPMNPGDTIEIKLGGIGTLRNYVVKK
jgi:2-keto-4-pentenoate hydratase/2-oxohepta-3-ene-1,7-dioic acid hydratase in catechol pathway